MSATKKIAIFCSVCILLGLITRANAEGIFGGKTLGQRLDGLGHTLFGTGGSEEKEPSPDQAGNQDVPQKTNKDKAASGTTPPRAGSVLAAPNASNEYAARTSPATDQNNQVDRYHAVPPPDTRNGNGAQPSPGTNPYRPLLGTSLLDDENTSAKAAERPAQTYNGPAPSNLGSAKIVKPDNQTPPPAQVNNTRQPLTHSIQNRLMQSRNSAFETPKTEQRSAALAEKPAQRQMPAGAENLEPIPSADSMGSNPAEQERSNSPAYRPESIVQQKVPGQPTLAKRPTASDQPGTPHLAQRPAANVRSADAGVGVNNPRTEVNSTPSAAPINPTRMASPAVKPKDDGLLFTRRGPVLSVETLGPRKIIVGKESTYEVALSNTGEVAADEVIVFVSLPEWAEVTHADASNGIPQYVDSRQPDTPLQWKVGRLEAKSKEKLSLKIIPRQSKPFDLAVRWDYKPVASQAMIEVQEPKLEMQLEGPRDVLYGKQESYRLKMTNTGTGSAEGVVVKLLPVGTGENVPATYQLGVLPAGESKTIEIELTARQAGELSIQVEAKGDAGVHAELAEKVLVRRAGLEVVVEGPRLQYVGSTGTYQIRVRNPGNAPAMNIRLGAVLPPGMKYVGGVEGMRADAAGVKLQWTLETLNPQLEQVFTLKLRTGTAGTARLDITASADDELNTVAGMNTQVDAAASLTLDVQDPVGPVSIGEETVYEVRIRNRGTKEAEGVAVFGYFSRGIEPTSAEGGPNRIGPGQVGFTPLATLAPGAEAVFKIHAKAETAGNHVFRAEVQCKSMGTRLISEKNTLYYQDSVTQRDPAASAPAEANRDMLTPENYRTQRR